MTQTNMTQTKAPLLTNTNTTYIPFYRVACEVPSPLLFVARAGLRVRISAQRNRFAYTYQSVLSR